MRSRLPLLVGCAFVLVCAPAFAGPAPDVDGRIVWDEGVVEAGPAPAAPQP